MCSDAICVIRHRAVDSIEHHFLLCPFINRNLDEIAKPQFVYKGEFTFPLNYIGCFNIYTINLFLVPVKKHSLAVTVHHHFGKLRI